MSLVVHKLVLSPGGATTNTQTPTHHVTLSAYTHSRSNVSDAMGRVSDGPSSGSMSTPSSSFPYSSSSSSSSSKHSSTYNLPFVLQDHNYGAPPPPTPPQSPPPLPSSSGSSVYHQSSHHFHQSHHQHSPQPHQHSHPHNLQSHAQQNTNNIYHPQHRHQSHIHPQQTITHTSPSPRLGIITSSGPSVSVSGLLTSHPLNTMPPHRQQFMPHPKTSIFPSPHIPPPPVELLQSPTAITGPPPSSTGAETDDDSRLSDRSSSVGPSGEETETAPEGEGDEQPIDDSITRCVCDFSHDDGYMIQCDRCFVWQHVDCMEIDRDNIPDEYLCEACDPRPIDRFKARALQIRRRQEIKAHLASSFYFRLSSSDSDDNIPVSSKGRGTLGKIQEKKVVKKKKVKQLKDMKNGRKGSLSLLKKTNLVSPGNNNIIPGTEDKERRMLVKRRRKSSSMSGGEGVSDDSNSGPVERLRAWVEGYEVAVTNHYSPELRARVHAARINGVSPDLRASTQGAVLGHRCKVIENPQPLFDVFDSKILVAATRLSINTAITEFQGKYLLASQWNAQQPVLGQPYLPYVLQYHMPKEGLTVCVDARTYGNDARFTRRSCQPNAEVRHVVERGSLHLYLVTTRDIAEGEEVTLGLETANSNLELVCCLSEEHDCQAPQAPKVEQTSPVPTTPHKKNGLILSNKKNFKKQQLQLQLRTSKRTTSTESRNSDNIITPIVNSAPVTPVKQRRASGCGKSPAKSPSVSVSSSPDDIGKDSILTTLPTTLPTPEMPKCLDKQQQQKMTREERKIAAYMKAFERMEKAAQRRQEMEKKKEEDKCKDPKDKDKKRCEGEEDDWEKTSSADECVRNTPGAERSRRKGKKGRGKGSPQKRNIHRVDSTASDLTGDESSCASVGLMSPVGGSIEGIALNFNSPPQGNSNGMGFRFPKTKKALMNEWLNENVDPVLPGGNVPGVVELPSGVPTCYMRSPATPLRRSSVNQTVIQGTLLNLDMPGGSAKKRWLRQAISEETESPQFNGLCPSPNSRPDSPTGGGDYITPLKKRRLARESMSSELSSTPPSTPVHSTSLEEDKMIEEMEAELAEEAVSKLKREDDNDCEERSCLMIDAENPSEYHVTKDSIARIKREVNEEENEELIVEDKKKIDRSRAIGSNENSVYGKFQEDVKGMKVKYAEEKAKKTAIRDSAQKAKHFIGLTLAKTLTEDYEQEDEEGEVEANRIEQVEVKKGRKCQQIKREKRQYIVNREKNQQGIRRERRQQVTKKGKSSKNEGKQVKTLQKDVKRKKGYQIKEKVEYEIKQEVKNEADDLEVKEETREIMTKVDDLEVNKEFKQKIKKEIDGHHSKKAAAKCATKKGVNEQEKRMETISKETGSDIGDFKTELSREKEAKKERKKANKVEEERPEEEVRDDLEVREENQGGEMLPKNEDTEIKRDKKSENIKSEEINLDKDKNTAEEIELKIVQKQGKVKKEKVKKNSKKVRIQHIVKKKKIVKPEIVKQVKGEVHRTGIEHSVQVNETGSQGSMVGESNKKQKFEKMQRFSPRKRKMRYCIKEKKQVLTRRKCTRQNLNKKIKKPQKQKEAEGQVKVDIGEDEKVEIKREEDVPQGITQAKNEHVEMVNEDETKFVEKCNFQIVKEESESQSSSREKNKLQEIGSGENEKLEIKIEKEQLKVKLDEGNGQDNDTKDQVLRNIEKCDKNVIEEDLKTDTSLLSLDPLPNEQKSQNTSSSSASLLPQQRKSTDASEENLERFRPSTPDSPRPTSPELRGPHTPDGPAPTTPEELAVSPQSPRSPMHCHRSPSPSQDCQTEGEETLEREHSLERKSRSRVRGPCTPPSPPPPVQEEENDEGEQEDAEISSKSSSQATLQEQPKSTPVKRKLSILEYRKRKSVSSESDSRGLSGPSDSSSPPPSSLVCSTALSAPCTDSLVLSSNPSSASNTSTREPSLSPTYLSPLPKLGRSEATESSPDIALSPVRPLLLTPLSVVLDGKSTKDEVKRDAESNGSSGGDSISDSSKHIIKSSSSNVSNSCSTTTITTIAVALNVFTSTSTAVSIAAGTTTAATPLAPITGNVTSQDVKWNAAPTLLEQQRENLTARLRREFGLCISDDDEDKSGLRLGCASMVGRPSPPLLPSPAPLVSSSSSPLSPRTRKPSGLQAEPDGEDRDRSYRRHKEKNLPPPPPPPTAPPKNSIFQGRQVTVQKVVCSSKVGATQPVCNPSQITNSSNISTGLLNIPTGNMQRLLPLPSHQGSSGTSLSMPGSYHGPTPVPIPIMGPSASSSRNGSSLQASQCLLPTAGIASSSVPLTATVPSPTVPMACPVTPPIGAHIPIAIQSKLSPIPSAQTLGGTSTPAPHHSSSVQIGPLVSSSLASQQNPAYPSRPYSRGQYSAPAAGMVPPAISLFPGRVPPAQAHNSSVTPQGPAPVRPQGQPAQAPPGLVSPSLGFNGNYSGHDCSAPGSRGS
ncbi:uncharacterized protein upSET isoform X1 [Procambarus clarkii]|uniref:uncharacterized protein upSET isoform X1 n=2 Tax=Procambarus clarkii TaxID=6728 RepID=UPI003742796B